MKKDTMEMIKVGAVVIFAGVFMAMACGCSRTTTETTILETPAVDVSEDSEEWEVGEKLNPYGNTDMAVTYTGYDYADGVITLYFDAAVRRGSGNRLEFSELYFTCTADGSECSYNAEKFEQNKNQVLEDTTASDDRDQYEKTFELSYDIPEGATDIVVIPYYAETGYETIYITLGE